MRFDSQARARLASIYITIALSLLLSLAVLVKKNDIYWRPYNVTAQDSLASFLSHGMAMANRLPHSSWNILMPHEIVCATGERKEYSHWPNGFFLTLDYVLRAFGNSETTGRSFALVLNCAGIFLLACSLLPSASFGFFILPLLLLSVVGRAGLSFVFADAALVFFLGLIALLAVHRGKSRYHDMAFIAAMLLSLAFVHMLFIFCFFFVLGSFLSDHKSKKKFIRDLALLGLGILFVMGALCAKEAGFVFGARELWFKLLHRTTSAPPGNPIGFWQGRYEHLRDPILMNVKMFALLLPLGFWQMFQSRRYLPLFFCLGAIAYQSIMFNYTSEHFFTSIPYVASILLICMLGAESLLLRAWRSRRIWSVTVTLIALVLVIDSCKKISGQANWYELDPHLQALRLSYQKLTKTNDLRGYTSFNNTSQFDAWGMCQYYFGEQISAAAQNKIPQKVFVYDLRDY